MRLVFDIEANGLYQEVTEPWVISAKDLETGVRYRWDLTCSPFPDGRSTSESAQGLLSVFSQASELVGHNIINYDIPAMKKLWGWVPSEHTKITDTLVMSRLENPDRPRPFNLTGKSGPHSLAAWGCRFGIPKVENEEWDVFDPIMVKRCDGDVDITERVYNLLNASLGEEWAEALAIEHEMARIMTEQEHHGILFDHEKAETYIQELSERIEAIDTEITPLMPYAMEVNRTVVSAPFKNDGEYKANTQKYIDSAYEGVPLVFGPFTRIEFLPFNLGSIQKVKDYLLSAGWIPDEWNFSKKTGTRTSPKLEGDFRGITGNIPTKVKERITWRHRRSQIQGWLDKLRPDGRLSAGANPCGTPTARMKHNTVVNIPKANVWTEKNLLDSMDLSNLGNLMWDVSCQKDTFGTQMRSLFTRPDGYTIVGHDASGIELRLLAHYMGDEQFIQTILSGDIHEANRISAGLPNRDAAKTFIYAFNYGAGNAKLGSIIGGTADDGAELRRNFLAALPNLDKLIKRVKRASGKGFLKGLDGRRIIMRKGDDGKVATHKALNTLLQCAGSVVMKKSCIILWDNVRKEGLDAHKILDMHDEGQAEVANVDVERFKELAVQSIIEAGEYFDLNIPLDAEAKAGMHLAETH